MPPVDVRVRLIAITSNLYINSVEKHASILTLLKLSYPSTSSKMATLFSPSQHTSKLFWDNTIARRLGLPPPQHRLIDFVNGRREIPMKLLCLGYSRTGTFSLLNALQKLGYNPYHMAEAMTNSDIDFPCWEQAIRQKCLDKTWEGREWGRQEFDKLLGRHDVR